MEPILSHHYQGITNMNQNKLLLILKHYNTKELVLESSYHVCET